MTAETLDLMEFLPRWMGQDESAKGMAVALQNQLRRIQSEMTTLAIYTTLDQQPEAVVDELAFQFNIPEYQSAMPLDTKRRLVRRAIHTHRTRGTAAAVQRVAESFFGFAEVKEWFEYGGEPYHFKIYVNGISAIQKELDELLFAVANTKNVRSVLESLVFYEVMEVPVYAGVYTQFAMTAITDLTLPRQGDAQAYIGTYTRAADVSITNITV